VASGYNLFQHVLEAGSFYEQVGALVALTSNDASVLGVGADVSADSLTYSIPYYLVFQEDIDRLFTGLVTQDSLEYGPTVSGDTVQPKDLFLEQVGGMGRIDGHLQLLPTWSTRIYTMLYGMALLSSNYDLSFLQRGQVVLVGGGEPLTVGAGFEEVRVSDPTSGRTYAAYYDPKDGADAFLGAKLVTRLQANVDALAALPADDPGASALKSSMRTDFEYLDILRAMYANYQYVY